MKNYHFQITSHACPESSVHPSTSSGRTESRRAASLTVFMLIAHCSLLIAVSSCGKKLPPVAPESVVPEPVKELRVTSRDGRLLIRFTKPSKNIDGSKLTDMAGFRVMRRVLDEKACKGCPEKFPVVYDIDISYSKGAVIEEDRILFPDKDLEPGIKYEYKVVPYNKDGYEGPEAPRAIFMWGVPPARPKNLAVKAGDKSADLTWVPTELLVDDSPVKEIAGYNIYRREDGGKTPLDPINPVPVKETSFSDFGLINGRIYHYAVRALFQVNEGLIEGASSDEITVIPKEAIIEE